MSLFSTAIAMEPDRELCLFAYQLMADENARLGSDWEEDLLAPDFVAYAEEMFGRFGSYTLPDGEFRVILNNPIDFRQFDYAVKTRVLEELLLTLAFHDGVATWRPNGAPTFLVSKTGKPETAFSRGLPLLAGETVAHEKDHLDVWVRWKKRLMQRGLSAEEAGRKAFFVMSSPLGRYFAEHSAVRVENKISFDNVMDFKTLNGIENVSQFVENVISRNLYPAEAAWYSAERLKTMLESETKNSSKDRQEILALKTIQKELAHRMVEDTKYMREQLAQKHEAFARRLDTDQAGREFHREWAKRLRTPPTLRQYYLGDKYNNLSADTLIPKLFVAMGEAHRNVWGTPIVK